MAKSAALVEGDTDMATAKEQTENRRFCGRSGEDGSEPSSSGSMKSPVTPAALCEPNGSPALRWKSYVAKQKELTCDEKPMGFLTSPTDGKGKLVINLCGSTRALPKVSPTSSEAKSVQGFSKKHEESGSSQGNGLAINDDDDAPSCEAPVNITPSESMPSGSSESVQNGGRQLRTLNGSNVTKNLAKAVCRRITMVRRTLKTTKKSRPHRAAAVLHGSEPIPHKINCKGVFSRLSRTCEENASDFCKEDFTRRKGDCSSHGVGEKQDNHSGSEEVIYSEDEGRSVDQQSRGKAPSGFTSAGNTQFVGDEMEPLMKDVANASAGVNEIVQADPPCNQQMAVVPSDIELPTKDSAERDHSYGRGRARSLSREPGALSETSKLDMKEQTVLETLLRDEPTGYSSGGGSEPSRSHRVDRPVCDDFVEKSGQKELGQLEESESSDAQSECSQSDGYDEGDMSSSESAECDEEDCNCDGLAHGGYIAGSERGRPTEKVPSVLCDAEGNIWHIGKRAQQANGKGFLKQLRSSGRLQETALGVASKGQSVLIQEVKGSKTSRQRVTPYSHLIDLNWKWPSEADYTIGSVGDLSNRPMVHKERAIFVGCIPDGTESLEEILEHSMEKFLERFDFAPSILSQIHLIKVVKDFAFLELATEKVAHVVLAANQLDVFEWGVNGFHFNIEGCKGTYTSVRPLIEYMALKPARVIFVTNIPKSRWQKDFLEEFFGRILRGSDAPDDCFPVKGVYLLPESCDAYVELALEVMADAIIFKCSKNPNILKEIGEDVFICRDPSSVPLMSKHKGNICPQRSLFVSVSAPGQDFKTDLVRKVFEEILVMIFRETNQPSYLEFISVQPGKDYAFFQFNSESTVDTFMEEYIMNTHRFVIGSTAVSYIILRPPEYQRPGARYRTERNKNGALATQKSPGLVHPRSGKGYALTKSKQVESVPIQQGATASLLARRFGDEPAKRTDCIMSIGVSPIPQATWNGVPSAGACAAEPESMLIIEGLPSGVSYKLLRGALNELFERSLCKMGLLEVGMLIVRRLDRDNNMDVVASLPNSKFVKALLSLKRTLVVAGNELKLLPKSGRRKVTWEGKIAEHVRGQGDVSCLSDDEVFQDETLKCRLGNGPIRPKSVWRKQELCDTVRGVPSRKKVVRRKAVEWDSEIGYAENIRSVATLLQKDQTSDIRDDFKISKAAGKVLSRQKVGPRLLKTVPTQRECKELTPRTGNAAGPLKFGKRDSTANMVDLPSEILHIVSEGGKRKICSVRAAPQVDWDLGKARLMKAFAKKRKLFQSEENTSLQKVLYMQQRFKKLRQGARVL